MIKKAGQEAYDEVNKQFPQGVNPYAFMLGFKMGAKLQLEQSDIPAPPPVLKDYEITDFKTVEELKAHCFKAITEDGGEVNHIDAFYIHSGKDAEALRCGRLLVNRMNYLRLGSW